VTIGRDGQGTLWDLRLESWARRAARSPAARSRAANGAMRCRNAITRRPAATRDRTPAGGVDVIVGNLR